MFNLFILNETFTNGLNCNLLNSTAFLSIICGILVIISKNPTVSVLFLIGLFLNLAGYLMMLGINFINMSYIVALTSVLFLFAFVVYTVLCYSICPARYRFIPNKLGRDKLLTQINNFISIQGVSMAVINTVVVLLIGLFGLLYVLTNHPYQGVLNDYALIFTVPTLMLTFFIAFHYYLRAIVKKVFLSLEWCFNTPPKPHGFSSMPVQSISNIWTVLFGVGPILYMCSAGPIYAADASGALGVKIDSSGILGAKVNFIGCAYNSGMHKSEIISITVLDRAWYGLEQCSIILQCAQCKLETTVGPVSSILIKIQQLQQVAG